MSFNIPNTFTAGTKAKADEVNENFASIKDELNKQNENIASIQEDVDYIRNDMFNDFVSEAEIITKTAKSKFCINYANISADGKTPDVLSFDENILSFKVGGNYPVLTITNAWGDSETFEYIDNLDITGYADGNYNIFLSLEGDIELFNTKIIKSAIAPTNVVMDDIWLMNLEPWACYKFNGLSWIEFEEVPIGSITIKEGKIIEVSNYTFNSQYLDADCNFITKEGRKNLSKRFETEWFIMLPKTTYTIEHNLNLNPLRYRARLVSKVIEKYSNFEAGDIIETIYSNYAGTESASEVGYILKYSSDTVTIGVGNTNFHCANDFGSAGCAALQRSNLEHKLIITEDVN